MIKANIKSGNTYESFRKSKGKLFALNSLKYFLKSLSKKYEVYLILDNPSAKEYDPKSFLANRLSDTSNLTKFTQIDPEEILLNNKLREIGIAAGAKVIDQISYLCPNGLCPRANKQGKPIYKDDHHLRPFFVIEKAAYLDAIVSR